MSYLESANAIKAILTEVEGVGKAHLSMPRADKPEEFKDLFMVGQNGRQVVNAWVIEREGFADLKSGVPGPPLGRWHRNSRFVVTGYYSVDAGEMVAFQDLLDRIATAFTVKPTLGSRVFYSDPPPIVRRISQEPFGRYFCHVAELEINVTERLSLS